MVVAKASNTCLTHPNHPENSLRLSTAITPDNFRQQLIGCREFLFERQEWDERFVHLGLDKSGYDALIEEMYAEVRYFESLGYSFEPEEDFWITKEAIEALIRAGGLVPYRFREGWR